MDALIYIIGKVSADILKANVIIDFIGVSLQKNRSNRRSVSSTGSWDCGG